MASTTSLLLTNDDDTMSIVMNKGAERPYFSRAVFLDFGFANMLILCLSVD